MTGCRGFCGGLDDFRDLVGEWPDDPVLVDWYRGEFQLLLDTFRAAPRDIDCARFLKSPDPLTFWTRRQAHEAIIHRADVATIVGRLTPVDTEFALDGIDELVDGIRAPAIHEAALGRAEERSLPTTGIGPGC